MSTHTVGLINDNFKRNVPRMFPTFSHCSNLQVAVHFLCLTKFSPPERLGRQEYGVIALSSVADIDSVMIADKLPLLREL